MDSLFSSIRGEGGFGDLGGLIRRYLRCVLWRQWKRRYTRAKRMMKYGISEMRAWKSASNGRGGMVEFWHITYESGVPKEVF